MKKLTFGQVCTQRCDRLPWSERRSALSTQASSSLDELPVRACRRIPRPGLDLSPISTLDRVSIVSQIVAQSDALSVESSPPLSAPSDGDLTHALSDALKVCSSRQELPPAETPYQGRKPA